MMENVAAGYGDKTVLKSVKLNLVPGSRIGLLGRNGAGKSTLIKLLAGEISALSGQVQLAKGVQLGYFAQHQVDTLRFDESPLWHLEKLAPEKTEQELRNYLGAFLNQGGWSARPIRVNLGVATQSRQAQGGLFHRQKKIRPLVSLYHL